MQNKIKSDIENTTTNSGRATGIEDHIRDKVLFSRFGSTDITPFSQPIRTLVEVEKQTHHSRYMINMVLSRAKMKSLFKMKKPYNPRKPKLVGEELKK